MRSSLAKIPYRATTTATSFSAAFSTSSSNGGGGRGRGHASPFQFTVGSKPDDPNRVDPSPPPPPSPPQGHGRGRGQPFPSSPVLPPLSSLLNSDSRAPPPLGRGRGFIPTNPTQPPPSPLRESPSPSNPPRPNARKPLLFVQDEKEKPDLPESGAQPTPQNTLPRDAMNILSGVGRGKPLSPPADLPEKPEIENRHVRYRPGPKSRAVASDKSFPGEKLSQEEKVKRAKEILSRGETGESRRGGRGERDGTGRGRGRDKGRGRYSDERESDEDRFDEADDGSTGQYFGDPEDEKKLVEKFGPEIMNELADGLDEMSCRVLPSPEDDDLVDAYHTNMLIECEPEYLMEEFGTNPDIDEKPPIPLRDALEKAKPFLIAYEGIQSQEEWEEIIEATMKNVPLMKKIVDYYSGPDRVTAKQQQEELESVAKTLPASAPASVKRFTDRAVLSLQSNPGWGFDKKCQFMDKLVMEVSQQYK
ncbi:hydroxyproline-rich glycoprotein family protein [Striga asiatica]|uniref:Hydroxyproline-rich glycoprotein family protein n=1 Tax=Striga asiatica TaxID=4170 RepID=A0A5A7QSX1_STRAF|nr:hydroxyproline-rich glycoprotein family protein [Striga asiatica]